jgi:hypothetical protein
MLAQESDRGKARSTAEDPNGHVSDGPTRQRKIIHIDMDAFYASVEQRDLLTFDKQSNIKRATRLASRKLRREFCDAACV